jgi:hypothetical protein
LALQKVFGKESFSIDQIYLDDLFRQGYKKRAGRNGAGVQVL